MKREYIKPTAELIETGNLCQLSTASVREKTTSGKLIDSFDVFEEGTGSDQGDKPDFDNFGND